MSGNPIGEDGVWLVMPRVPKDKEALLAIALSRRRKSERVRGKDQRSARLAANEAIFRAGNERIRSLVADALPRTPYICECGDETCFEQVELAKHEYERVREDPAHFFVSPGHEDTTAGERVVERCDHFTVVEKQGRAKEVVTRTDPRKE